MVYQKTLKHLKSFLSKKNKSRTKKEHFKNNFQNKIRTKKEHFKNITISKVIYLKSILTYFYTYIRLMARLRSCYSANGRGREMIAQTK